MRIRTVATSTRSGIPLLQDPGFSPFGTLLAPGSYASVTLQALHQSCFLSVVGTTRVEVVGVNGQNVRTSGVATPARH